MTVSEICWCTFVDSSSGTKKEKRDLLPKITVYVRVRLQVISTRGALKSTVIVQSGCFTSCNKFFWKCHDFSETTIVSRSRLLVGVKNTLVEPPLFIWLNEISRYAENRVSNYIFDRDDRNHTRVNIRRTYTLSRRQGLYKDLQHTC